MNRPLDTCIHHQLFAISNVIQIVVLVVFLQPFVLAISKTRCLTHKLVESHPQDFSSAALELIDRVERVSEMK